MKFILKWVGNSASVLPKDKKNSPIIMAHGPYPYVTSVVVKKGSEHRLCQKTEKQTKKRFEPHSKFVEQTEQSNARPTYYLVE